ncbi:MAG: PilZ domain-containing protein [Nitrospirae bacterium]|nr:PilZ domain-containing protein [Nitrospirota bacterium]
MSNAVEQRITEIVARYANKPTDEVNEASLLRKDLGLDSLIVVEILFEIETLLGTSVQDDWITECRTVGDVVRAVKREYPDLISMLENKERRSSQRKTMHLPIVCSNKESALSTYSLDVSNCGICIVSRIPGRPGELTEIQLPCSEEWGPLKMSGIVIDSRLFSANGANLYRVGMDFSHSDVVSRKNMDDFLRVVSSWNDTPVTPYSSMTNGLGGNLLSFRKRVYLKETNLLGNVYFANYFDWQGMAREEFMHSLLPPDLLLSGIKISTMFASVKFLKEVTLYDDVEIQVFLPRADRFRIELVFLYFNVQTQEQISVGRQIVAFVKPDGGAIPVPDSFRAAFLDKYM